MKTLVEKCWLLLAVVLVGSACDDDKDAGPSGSLLPQFWEVMSQGGYWSEDVRFVYLEDGQVHISDKDIREDHEGIIGGNWYPNDVLMEQFYYDPQTYYLHQYVLVSGRYEDPVYCYHPNRFRTGPGDQTATGFHILSKGSYELRLRNAMSDIYIHLVSVSTDEIVMEVPIKTFIYDNWLLDSYDGYAAPVRYYSRLRTTWRRITDPERLSQLESATPFDEESPEE